MIGLRPHNHVHLRRAGGDFRPFRLCDTAGDGDLHFAARSGFVSFQTFETAQFRINFLGCFLADMAGVEDDEIRALGRLRHTIAQGF